MNPNTELLAKIDKFLVDKRTGQEVDDWAFALWQSLQRGEPAPDWGLYSLGTSYYRCRKVLHDRGGKSDA